MQTKFLRLALLSTILAPAAMAQPGGFTVPAAQEAVRQAYTLAGARQRADADALCRAPGARPLGAPSEGAEPAVVRFAPTHVFDNLYYFGSTYVGATIVRTTKGLVLIDSLTTSEAAADELLGGMKAMGLNPADIRYLILTHGHGDHYGGIPFLRERHPNFHVVASEDDWTFLKKPSLKGGQPDPSPKAPRRADDIGYTDTTDLTVGDTVFHLIETPGHTPGTTSLLYNVKVNGRTEEIMQWGGGGPADARVTDATFARFAERAKTAKASIRWSSHARLGWTTLYRQISPGSPVQSSLVEGQDAIGRYLDIVGLCRKAIRLQSGGS